MPEQKSNWIVDVGEEDFEREVIERSRERPVVVDFWAEWCGPCRSLGPILEKLAEEAGGEFVLARVDVDRARGLAAAYRIQGIPAVKAFRDGKPILEFVGAIPEPKIREFLARLRPSPADLLAREGAELEGTDPAGAEAAYRRALAAEPGDPAVSLALARLLIARGETAEARQVLDRARAGGDMAEVEKLDALLFLAEAGKKAGSLKELRALLQAKPEEAEIRFRLGTALAAAGKYPEALEMLYSAAERDRKLAAEKVREVMVKIFFAVGARSPLADEYRSRLARLLY
jgi:putative thioredoxin